MCNTPVAQQLTVYEPAAQGGVHCQHKPSTFNFQRQLRSKSQALPQCSASLGSTTLLTPFGAPFGTLTFNSVRSSPWEFDFQLPLSIPFEAPFGAPTFNFHFQLRSKLPLGVRLSIPFGSLGLRIEGPPLARAPPGGGNGRLIP